MEGGIILGRNIHPAVLGGSVACREFFLNGAFWCIFGSDFVLKNLKNYHFLYKFFNKNFKNYYFLYKK